MEPLERYYGVDRIQQVFEEIGYDRILFGSDFPTTSLEAQIEVMKRVVPAEQHQEVFWQNARRLGERFGWWNQAQTSDAGRLGKST